MDVLVTYDIGGTDEEEGAKRLRRIAKVCQKYGQRVRFSVFECRVSNTRLERMIGEIEDVFDRSCDSVIIDRFPGEMESATLRLGCDKQERKLGEP